MSSFVRFVGIAAASALLLSRLASCDVVVDSIDSHITYTPASSWYVLDVTGSTDGASEFLLGDRSYGIATFTFPQASTSVQWWGYQRSDGGLASFCIDSSTSCAQVSYYNSSTNGSEAPRLLYSTTGLTNAVHTVTITNILDPSVNGYGQMTVDRFVLSGTPVPPAPPVAPSFPEDTFLAVVPMQSTYHVPLILGGNSPAVEVLLDTGASGAWVVWEGCEETQCQGHNVYQPSTTDFYNFSIQDTEAYGNGGPANTLGSWRVNDSVTFGSTSIPSTTFGAAYSLPSGGEGLDGNFGMAKAYFVGASEALYPNFVEAMYVAGILKNPVLAFYQLNSADVVPDGVTSVAQIGGIDADKFTGKMDWIPMNQASMWTNPQSQRWVQATSSSTPVDTTASFTHPAITFDTGDPGSLAPPHDDWLVLMSAVGAQGPDSNGNYLIPCSSAMIWNFFSTQGYNYTIPLADTTTDNGSGFCSPSANDAGDTTNWIIGAPFLDTFYLAFHYEANLMGLAQKNLGASAANTTPFTGSTA